MGRCDARESNLLKKVMSTFTTIHPITAIIAAKTTFSSVISASGMVVVVRASMNSMY